MLAQAIEMGANLVDRAFLGPQMRQATIDRLRQRSAVTAAQDGYKEVVSQIKDKRWRNVLWNSLSLNTERRSKWMEEFESEEKKLFLRKTKRENFANVAWLGTGLTTIGFMAARALGLF